MLFHRRRSFGNPTTFAPTHYSSPIQNSPGKDSVPSQGSSILTTNELGGGEKSSPGGRSSIDARNEDLPVTTVLSFGGFSPGVSILERDSGFRRRSFAGSNASSSIQNSGFQLEGGFPPSQSFPTSFPSGVDQRDTSTSHATLVSIFCHDCGLFFRGAREEGLEVLDRHRCTGPIVNGGHADGFDISPLIHSNGSGFMGGFPAEAHGREAFYSDGSHQPAWNQGTFRFVQANNDGGYPEVSGPPTFPPPVFGRLRDASRYGSSPSFPPFGFFGSYIQDTNADPHRQLVTNP